ncbi:MAG: site-specific integrase [Psychrobium sp.]
MFRGMVRYGIGTLGLYLPNVAEKISCREPEGRVRWITPEEANRLINEAKKIGRSPHLADFITLALNTGMRKGEMLGMEHKRIDLNNRRLLLDSMHTKTRRRRAVPLNDAALAVIHRRLQWRQSKEVISKWLFCHADGSQVVDVKNAFTSAVRKAGIEDFVVHDLRHTAASWMVMNGVDIYSVRDVLGHLDITSTQRYAHLAPENLRAAVEAINSGSGDLGKLVAVG